MRTESAGGELRGMYERWRTVLVRSIAHVEAYLDFGEDEGIEDDAVHHALAEVRPVSLHPSPSSGKLFLFFPSPSLPSPAPKGA